MCLKGNIKFEGDQIKIITAVKYLVNYSVESWLDNLLWSGKKHKTLRGHFKFNSDLVEKGWTQENPPNISIPASDYFVILG